MPPPAKRFKKMRGGGDLYMTGVDKNDISKFIPGQISGLALWIQADKTKCVFKSVQEYTKGVFPSIAANILSQYGDNPSQNVLIEIESLVVSQPNSLVRLEVDTTGRTRFPTFVSEPEKLDVISIQDMIDPTNPKQRKEKLSTKMELNLSSTNMSVYSISTNINITFNDTLKTLLISVADITAPVTEFAEILVFSRILTASEVELIEGYLAYRRNDQYLLKLNHTYLPNIDSFPFIKDLAIELSDAELSLRTDMEHFDAAVKKYRSHLPTAELLQKAPPLKEKATTAIAQLSVIRQNIAKGALLARKQKTETIDAAFDSINKLSLYSEPFTAQVFTSKIADCGKVMGELEAYMKSLENVDIDIAAAVDQNNISDQIKRRSAAKNAEVLEDAQDTTDVKQQYITMRKKMDAINALGKTKYDAMYTAFVKKMKLDGENFNYFYTAIKGKWDLLLVSFNNLDKRITSGEWLTYDTAISSANTILGRDGLQTTTKPYHIQYENSYLDRIQTLYEHVRNQIVEGDLVFLRDEAEYIMSTFNTLSKKLDQKKVSPLSKKMFTCYFKKKLKLLIQYEAAFKKLYTPINDAINELTRILDLNKRYSSSQIKLEKEFPIPIIYLYKDTAQTQYYIRAVNKHDHSLTMIEYVATKSDGTLLYLNESDRDVELIFPSLENLSKNDVDAFYKKALKFCDDSGNPLFQKYTVLKSYAKTESVLDSISQSQVLPKYFHAVDALFEVPRDAENSIYEMSVNSPQRPILLPKYAVADGAFFICVNAGDLPFHIQIPGFTEDAYDLLGPDEVCMYIYTGVANSDTSFYGRVQWMENRLPYDVIYDVPRTSDCCKISELSKYICMLTPTIPLFDRKGFLVEVIPDKNSNIYSIDDIHHAAPYKVTIGDDMKISDLEINIDWGEKPGTAPIPTKFTVLAEAGTGLAMFCNSTGIPAINEFGYTQYLRAPILQIKDTLVTRSSQADSIEVELKPDVTLIQYGIISNKELFEKEYRSNFVKPTKTDGEFMFVNSTGFPLVSPTGAYIQVENFTFEPPYYVKYTENFVTQYAYIPEESEFFVPSKNVLSVKAYPMLTLRNMDEKNAIDISRAIKTTTYRYNTGKAYIQYTITKLQTERGTCVSMQPHFSDIEETIELLDKCIKDITGYQADYISYEPTITAIKTRELISDKTNDEILAMSTFDLKMKDTLERVYKSFTTGIKPVIMFQCIVKRVDKIRAEIKGIRRTDAIEIETSIINIQTVIQNQSLLQGTPANPELTKLLNTCTKKKLEFDGVVKTLEDALNTIPGELDPLERWVNDQDILIDRAKALHKEILDMDNLHAVNVFTQQLTNNFLNTKKQLEEIKGRVSELIEYKKKIAKWIGVYPDAAVMNAYNDDLPIVSSTQNLKGYSISFPVFEELQNPLITRDWYSLVDTDILSKPTRTRILIGLVDPIKGFVEKYRDYFTKYDISANIPEAATYQRMDEGQLKGIVDTCNKNLNELIAEALDAEETLTPIFNEYITISSDLRAEIQKVLEGHATAVQAKWIECTEMRTAIQTNLKLLEPYFDEGQIGQANKINSDMDGLFSSDKLSEIDDIQRSLKVADYYKNMSHMRLIQLKNQRDDTFSYIGYLHDQLATIQDSATTLNNDMSIKLRGSVETGRNDLQKEVTKMKSEITDGSKLKEFGDTFDPLMVTLMAKTATDVPSSIGIMRNIDDTQRRLKNYTV